MGFPDIPMLIVRDSHFKNASSSSKKSPLTETNSCSVGASLTRPTQWNASSLNCEGDFYPLPLKSSQSLSGELLFVYFLGSSLLQGTEPRMRGMCSVPADWQDSTRFFQAYFHFTSFLFLPVETVLCDAPPKVFLGMQDGSSWDPTPPSKGFSWLFKNLTHTHTCTGLAGQGKPGDGILLDFRFPGCFSLDPSG